MPVMMAAQDPQERRDQQETLAVLVQAVFLVVQVYVEREAYKERLVMMEEMGLMDQEAQLVR